MGPLWRLFWTLSGIQITSSSAQEVPRSPQDATRRPQDRSRLPSLFKIVIYQKIMNNQTKINDLGSLGRLQIAPRWPQAKSRWPKIDPRRLQDGLEECFCSCSKYSSIWRRLGVDLGWIWDRFGLISWNFIIFFGGLALMRSNVPQVSQTFF